MNAQREFLDLKRLLMTWKLEHLLQHFLTENITVEVLQMMKLQHIPIILRDFTLGDQIRFEFNLELWRQNIGRPLKSHQQAPSIISMPRTTTPTTATNKYDKAAPKRHSAETQTFDMPAINQMEVLPTFTTPSPPPPLTPYARPPKSQQPHTINLREILESCIPRGQQLLQQYAQQKRFHHGQRGELISVVSSYFDDNGIHLSLQMSYELEKELLELFPTERLEDYRTEKRGKIYMRVCNMKHYKRKARKLMASAEEQAHEAGDEMVSCYYDDETEGSGAPAGAAPVLARQSWSFENVDFVRTGGVKRELEDDDGDDDDNEEDQDVCL